MSETAQPMCIFPPCAQFGAPADSPVSRLCGSCGRPLSGPRFGRGPGYRLEDFLGSGYFADVFRACDLGSGLAYAVKTYDDVPPKRHAWTRETEAFQALAHRRLPALKEAFDDDGRLFLVMELVEGASLRQEVETHGPLSPERAVKLGIEVGEALEYTASQGWTFRDLHPRNIHVDTPKGAMLLDLDGTRPPGWPGRPAGRAGYRAPELATERSVSAACDTYSLVGCLYFALLGDDPPAEPGPLPELRGPLGPFPELADLLDAGRRADPIQRPGVGTIRATLQLVVWSEG
jgi:serine/threonine protein kinase